MRLFVKRDELEKAISLMPKGVLAGKQSNPYLDSILFKRQDGILEIYGTDLEIEIMHRIELLEAEGDNEGFCIEAKLINEVVKNLPEDDVEMIYDLNILEVKSGKSRFRLNTIPPDEFPDFSTVEEKITTPGITGMNLKNALEKVIFCAATDEFTKNLNGVFWEFKDGFLRLVAADGFRLGLAEKEVHGFLESFSFLLPLKSMKDILRILSEKEGVVLKIGKSKVNFFFGDMEVVVRMVDAEFPDYGRVFPEEFEAEIYVNKSEILEALKRVSIPAKFENEAVKLEVREGEMILRSETQDFGEAQETVEIETITGDITVGFNPRFLIDAIKRIDEETVWMRFGGEYKPLVITGRDFDNVRYVVMPMRM